MDKNGLYSIEVIFLHGEEVKRYAIFNQSTDDIKVFRQCFLSEGFMVPVFKLGPDFSGPIDEWVIVNPWNIKSMTVTRQKKFVQQ